MRSSVFEQLIILECRYMQVFLMNFPLLMLLTAARRLNGQKNAHNQVYRVSALVLPKGRKQRPRRMMNWSLILSYVKKLSMLSFWGMLHCQWTHPPEPHESALCCSELHSDSTVTQVCTNTGSCSRYVIYCNSTKNCHLEVFASRSVERILLLVWCHRSLIFVCMEVLRQSHSFAVIAGKM